MENIENIEAAINEAIEAAVTTFTGERTIIGEGFDLHFRPAEGITLDTSAEYLKEEVVIGPEEFWSRSGWATWEDEPQSTRDFVEEYYGSCWVERLGIEATASVADDFCDNCNMVGGYCGDCDGSHWNQKKERTCQCGSGEQWSQCQGSDSKEVYCG